MSSLSVVLAATLIAVVAAVELADPTMPPSHVAAGPEASAALSLQAIVRSRDREFAVIDGKRVGQGDRVGAWRVVEISSDAVRLRDGGRELELRLAPEIRREVIPSGGKP